MGADVPHPPSRPRPATRGRDRGIGVLLVDPIPLYRDGLASVVARAGGLRWLGSTHSAHSAVLMAERVLPDVLVLDSALDPNGNLTTLLTGSAPALAVLVLVREPHRTAQYLAEAFAAGADGVVQRSADPAQLVQAIRRAHAERRYLDPALSALAPRTRDSNSRQPLSTREHEVLALVADGLENQAIGDRLYVSVETVRTHVKSILRKLHARDRAHAVSLAFRLGVLVNPPRYAAGRRPVPAAGSASSAQRAPRR